jgi:hypothetical protein
MDCAEQVGKDKALRDLALKLVRSSDNLVIELPAAARLKLELAGVNPLIVTQNLIGKTRALSSN